MARPALAFPSVQSLRLCCLIYTQSERTCPLTPSHFAPPAWVELGGRFTGRGCLAEAPLPWASAAPLCPASAVSCPDEKVLFSIVPLPTLLLSLNTLPNMIHRLTFTCLSRLRSVLSSPSRFSCTPKFVEDLCVPAYSRTQDVQPFCDYLFTCVYHQLLKGRTMADLPLGPQPALSTGPGTE